MNTKTLTLGSKSWEIPQLPIRAVVELEPLARNVQGIKTMLDIIYAAIKCVDPSFSKEMLMDLHITRAELDAGMKLVIEQSGMMATSPGEDKAA